MASHHSCLLLGASFASSIALFVYQLSHRAKRSILCAASHAEIMVMGKEKEK
jgi:hypothetical protein